MTTRAGLLTVVREILANTTQWPDATVNAWIADAIRDYSGHFPRRVTATITVVADQREYALSSYTGIQALVQVEYPAGEDPPEYLVQRREEDPRGFWGLACYDVRGHDPPATLVIGEKPAAGETIDVAYHADHGIPAADADVLTVPDRHLDALVLFCRWRAMEELHADEARAPDSTTVILSMLGTDVGRAERAYRDKIRGLQKEQSRPATVQWDLTDRWRGEEWA